MWPINGVQSKMVSVSQQEGTMSYDNMLTQLMCSRNIPPNSQACLIISMDLHSLQGDFVVMATYNISERRRVCEQLFKEKLTNERAWHNGMRCVPLNNLNWKG